MDSKTKRRMTYVTQDPWRAVEKEKYHSLETLLSLVDQVDEAIYESDIDQALLLSFIARRLAHKLKNDEARCLALGIMASAYRIAGNYELAVTMIEQAVAAGRESPFACAQAYWRWAIIIRYQGKTATSIELFNKALAIFTQQHDNGWIARTYISRGISYYKLGQCEKALEDEQQGIALLTANMPSLWFIAAMINTATFLIEAPVPDSYRRALKAVEQINDILHGNTTTKHQRVRVLLQWIQGKLFAALGKLQQGAGYLDRAETGMKRLSLNEELRVLYADLAMMRTHADTIIAIAKKALKIESDPKVRVIIEKVVRQPTPDNVLRWRSSLSSYLPIFQDPEGNELEN